MCVFLFQRNSVSPAEREKYRPRSPPELEDSKRRKEDKLTHVSQGPIKTAETITSKNIQIFLVTLRIVYAEYSMLLYVCISCSIL